MPAFKAIYLRALEHRVPPPIIAAVLAIAMWGASWLPPALPLASTIRQVAVGMLVVAGIACSILGLLAFRRSRTTVNPMKPSKASTLVTTGIYGHTRNPMYLGLASLLTAWALQLSMLWPFMGPLLFALYINRFQIAPEERALHSRFGDDYEDYAARVRRWL